MKEIKIKNEKGKEIKRGRSNRKGKGSKKKRPKKKKRQKIWRNLSHERTL